MPAGRPTKYRPEYCDTVVELGIQGMTKAEMALKLDITKDTLYRWIKEHPEFSDAMKRAEQGMERWFANTFREMSTGDNKGNVTAAIFLAKNQLPDVYRDRHEHKVEAEVGVFEISYEGSNYGDQED